MSREIIKLEITHKEFLNFLFKNYITEDEEYLFLKQKVIGFVNFYGDDLVILHIYI